MSAQNKLTRKHFDHVGAILAAVGAQIAARPDMPAETVRLRIAARLEEWLRIEADQTYGGFNEKRFREGAGLPAEF
jgi:hypothetical protein